MIHEFSIIERYFKPLSQGYNGSLQLSDDAALIDIPTGRQLVCTKDALCEGTHFGLNNSVRGWPMVLHNMAVI